jgi:hypothetical protein
MPSSETVRKQTFHGISRNSLKEDIALKEALLAIKRRKRCMTSSGTVGRKHCMTFSGTAGRQQCMTTSGTVRRKHS